VGGRVNVLRALSFNFMRCKVTEMDGDNGCTTLRCLIPLNHTLNLVNFCFFYYVYFTTIKTGKTM
jgi:hypothetical protein